MAVLAGVLGMEVHDHHAGHIGRAVVGLGLEAEVESCAYHQCAESSLEALHQSEVVVEVALDLEVALPEERPIAQVVH